ncbi:Uma2 family endonuclease, partial [Candidatus Poribacteria bacterium]|nr:Uma2 family endonuclease [Candidatus Poribacteria bacterium]
MAIETSKGKTRIKESVFRHFSVEEYHLMGKSGVIREDERVELIEGRIVKISPIGSKHTAYVKFLIRKLRDIEKTAIMGVQDPIILNDNTEPQPDVSIVKFKANAYADSHPRAKDVFFLIEVDESSLEEDRQINFPIYAASAIPEVWLFNLMDNIVEVYTEPTKLANGISGYKKRRDYKVGEILSPGAFPDLRIE